ncbi:unnamed protein product [Camellia sinensis]
MKDVSGNFDSQQWSKEENGASVECSNVESGGLVDFTSQFITNEVFKSKEELLGQTQCMSLLLKQALVGRAFRRGFMNASTATESSGRFESTSMSQDDLKEDQY